MSIKKNKIYLTNLFIIDWDDTLFPTTWVNKNNIDFFISKVLYNKFNLLYINNLITYVLHHNITNINKQKLEKNSIFNFYNFFNLKILKKKNNLILSKNINKLKNKKYSFNLRIIKNIKYIKIKKIFRMRNILN